MSNVRQWAWSLQQLEVSQRFIEIRKGYGTVIPFIERRKQKLRMLSQDQDQLNDDDYHEQLSY